MLLGALHKETVGQVEANRKLEVSLTTSYGGSQDFELCTKYSVVLLHLLIQRFCSVQFSSAFLLYACTLERPTAIGGPACQPHNIADGMTLMQMSRKLVLVVAVRAALCMTAAFQANQ
jgi:hypothetical protein